MLNFHILRSHSVLGVAGRTWCGPAGLLQCLWLERDSWLLAGTSPQARCGPPLSSREERQGITWNIRQPYHLTLSLYEATLWSLSILDDKICRWKPAFAPCLSLPAPARLKVP